MLQKMLGDVRCDLKGGVSLADQDALYNVSRQYKRG